MGSKRCVDRPLRGHGWRSSRGGQASSQPDRVLSTTAIARRVATVRCRHCHGPAAQPYPPGGVRKADVDGVLPARRVRRRRRPDVGSRLIAAGPPPALNDSGGAKLSLICGVLDSQVSLAGARQLTTHDRTAALFGHLEATARWVTGASSAAPVRSMGRLALGRLQECFGASHARNTASL